MPKSKSRHVVKCEDCSLCEKVRQFHKYNDISKLLIKVSKWDICVDNQFKQIGNYECLVCCFKTNIFNDWKCHILSVSHLLDCHKTKNVYSYVCCNKKCKVVLYGSEKSLLKHTESHESQVASKQKNCVSLSGIPMLMVEVMKLFDTKENNLYFCSHCKTIAKNRIHDESKTIKTLKNPIIYYCKFCRVEFFSSPELIDVHSLSVEHLTLKCFDELCNVAKINSKKIKLSEPKFVQSINPSNEKNVQPEVQNAHTKNLVKLPMVVLNRFEVISPYKGECDLCKIIKCKLCNISVGWDSNKIISHLLSCEYKCDLRGTKKLSFETFECNLCEYSTISYYGHKTHMVSCLHFTNCHDTDDLYSYFCKACNKFMYSHITAIKNHWKLHIKDNITEMPLLSTFMANVLKDFNKNPNRITLIHYYDKIESNEFSKTVSIVCDYCKIEFHTSADDYNMHEMSSEHIILRFLTPKTFITNEDNSITKITKPSMNKPIHSTSLLQNLGDIQVVKNKHLKIDQFNESQTNLGQNYSERLSIVQQDQKIIKNNDLVNQFEYSCTQKLTPHYNKQQYTKYFNHKLNILNVLRQYKDRIIKTLSYYCDVCDFMTEEKYIWETHNQMEHQDCSIPKMYCSSCSMLIFGPNSQEHNNTIEHSILLQFLNSMQIVENNLEKNTALIKSVENITLDKMPGINLDINEEFTSKNKISEEVLQFQNTAINSCKTNNDLLLEDKDDNKKNSKEISTLISVNEHQNVELESVAITSSHIVKLIKNAISTKDANFSKDVDKMQKQYCCKNVSISTENSVYSDVEVDEVMNEVVLEGGQSKNEVSHIVDKTIASQSDVTKQVNTIEFLEDGAYGEYVTQRLQLIKNTSVKQDVKLEIDYLFYTKIKQMTLNK